MYDGGMFDIPPIPERKKRAPWEIGYNRPARCVMRDTKPSKAKRKQKRNRKKRSR